MSSKMKMDELYHLHKSGLPQNQIILDVRDTDEFAEGHVEGAINIPVDELPNHFEKLKNYSKIYVHCGGGGRAGRAVETLTKYGIQNLVHICESGMRSWIASGLPIEK